MTDSYQKYGDLFHLDEQHFQDFFPLLKKQVLKKKEFFLQAGSHCNYHGFVISGVMRSYYINESGEDITYKFHLENQFFTNYESILLNVPSRMNIAAMRSSEIFLLHKSDLTSLYDKGSFWQAFGRIMTERMYLETITRVEDFIYLSNENRYKKLLEENPEIFQQVPQRYIASFLGITPQSLSRIRNRIGKS